MSLKEDVGEVVNEWGKASWKGRALLLLGLLLSASSIASLADTVFQWKGFLLRGVDFYRTHIAVPTANLVADLVGRPITQEMVDVTVLFGLFFGALIRIETMQPISLARRIGRVLAQVLLCILSISSVLLQGSASVGGTAVWVAYPFYVLAACVLVKGRERVQAVIYMTAPVLLVAAVAAVSEGLSR